MKPSWFKPQTYPHFDVPVGENWASAIDTSNVKTHSWSPLIYYMKKTKRYKAIEGKTVPKLRNIMMPSHRDAAIFAKYSAELVSKLDAFYRENGLENTAVAYRALGKANYHLAKEVQDYIRVRDPVQVLCFDVSAFFDNLNHAKLKTRLKELLGVTELPGDWFNVFRSVTKYHYVDRVDLKALPIFADRMAARGARRPIGTIAEVKAAGVPIRANPNPYGIPQGTPISVGLSNLYMIDFDLCLKAAADATGALYRRYSDDILIVCKPEQAADMEALVLSAIASEALKINDDKTERTLLNGARRLTFQYLGYEMGDGDARVRQGTMARQPRR